MKSLIAKFGSHRAIVVPICAMIFGLAAGGMFLRVNLVELRSLNDQATALSEELTLLTELQSIVIRGEEVLEGVRDELSITEQRIPASMDFGSFYSELTTLSRKYDVSVSQIIPKAIEVDEKYEHMAISLSAESSFQSFYRFIAELKHTPRLSRWERLDIQTTDEDERCEFEMTLSIYAINDGGQSDG